MGTDHNIDLTDRETMQNGSLLTRRSETRKHFDIYGECSQALQECFIMLLGENRCRHKDRDLLAIHHSFERNPQCDLGLTITYIAAKQAIHRPRGFHITLDLSESTFLIVSFDIWKRIFQLFLPGCVGL